MKRIVVTVATVLMIGSWAGDGGHPAVYFRYTGDVIDFYGPCDEGPT